MVERFVELCWRRVLKISIDKSKVMVLDGEEGFEYEIRVDEARLERISEFRYLGCRMTSFVGRERVGAKL